MRILAIDYGRKRMGLAISDPLGITAQPLCRIDVVSRKETVKNILKFVKEREVEEVVIGFPLCLDGTEGLAAKEVKDFVAILSKELFVPVILVDERLTSAFANRLLIESGQSGKKKRDKIDVVAAQSILQSYLDSNPHISSR
ncbi:MAG: Holliday junction resolvase RuvX [Planctomycetota bacterium]